MKSRMYNVDESWNLENLCSLSWSYKDFWLGSQVLNQRLKLLFTDSFDKVEYMIKETDILEFTFTNVKLKIRSIRFFKVNYRLQFA
jgi:hypothetical protein